MDSPGDMDLPFMLVPDEHGQDCAQYFDIGGYMRKITVESLANDVFSQRPDGSRSHETFLDLLGESCESRDYLRYLADGPEKQTGPNPGNPCEVCGEDISEGGFEVYSELSDTEVIRWFSKNRPDLIYAGLIVRSDDWNPNWNVMLRLLRRTLINFRGL
jgi:hypothetical protein